MGRRNMRGAELRSSSDQGRRSAGRRMTADPASALSGALLASYRRAVDGVAAVEDDIRAAALQLTDRWERGGRHIYLGAGAAGLVAAEDAVESPGSVGSVNWARIARQIRDKISSWPIFSLASTPARL